MGDGVRRTIEIRAGEPGDDDASQAAAVLGAYFEAEHARASRQRVWRVVAVGSLVVCALRTATSILTGVDLVFGLGLLGCAAVASVATEWRARKRLGRVVRPARSPHPPAVAPDEEALPARTAQARADGPLPLQMRPLSLLGAAALHATADLDANRRPDKAELLSQLVDEKPFVREVERRSDIGEE